jgi:uncharacterized protein (TIGR03790 family)
LLLLCLTLLFTPVSGLALPTAEQVAIVANKNVPDSLAIASLYASARNIPGTQLFALDLPTGETISRADYEQRLVEPLRAQLAKQKFSNRIKIITLIFGVPLRVAAPEPDDGDKQRLLLAESHKRTGLTDLTRTFELAEAIAPDSGPAASFPQTGQISDLFAAIDASLQRATRRLGKIKDDEARTKATGQLAEAVTLFAGPAALAANIKPSESSANDDAVEQLRRIEKQSNEAKNLLRELATSSTPSNHLRMYAVAREFFGAVGLTRLAIEELSRTAYEQADASVDSELGLLWWDREDYTVNGRIPNPFYYLNQPTNTDHQQGLPVLMVGRIDGPTAKSAKEMIERTLLAEKNGLKGNAYIDAKGDRLNPKVELSVWDQKLRDFAWMLRRVTDYRVTLDDYRPLLKDAPDTALYVGWYQLRNYQDVFTFTPGSIGYHIASEEAVSIHQPEEKGWCKNMLERGIAATVGAIAEPFLDSFPEPRTFFGLLLTGRYSLVEAYYLTSPYISWRMVLFGDPLYTPWKGQFDVPIKELALQDKNQNVLETLPVSPIDIRSEDPLEARAALERVKVMKAKAIDEMFAVKAPQATQSAPQPRLP